MIFNFIFGRHKKDRKRKSGALADLRVGESAICPNSNCLRQWRSISELSGLSPVSKSRSRAAALGGDPRVYRVEGTEAAMRRDVSRHIHVELLGAPALWR